MEDKLRGGTTRVLRVGASQTVLREHLPGVLRSLRGQFPKLKLILRTGYQQELEHLLGAAEIELAVTVIDRAIATGIRSSTLIQLPLTLIVPKNTRVRGAEEILGQDRIAEPLISIRAGEAVPRLFQQELVRRGVAWPVAIEVGTLELVSTYVAEGFGTGLGVGIPGARAAPGTRILPLQDFPRLSVGVLWTGKLTSVAKAFADLLAAAAKALSEAEPAGAGPASGSSASREVKTPLASGPGTD
jgi:DNA-binding transcriptional LysR family regulator